VNHLLKLLAAILHFGNIEFFMVGETVDIADIHDQSSTVSIICELLEIDADALQRALVCCRCERNDVEFGGVFGCFVCLFVCLMFLISFVFF
jgi:myosin heavy subunit